MNDYAATLLLFIGFLLGIAVSYCFMLDNYVHKDAIVQPVMTIEKTLSETNKVDIDKIKETLRLNGLEIVE